MQDKPNYIGQLYDVTSVTLSATPTTVDEGGTRQLNATATLDDLTTLILAATEVQWSVLLGPLTGIDASGLATADVVFEDTAATAQGTFQGVDGQLALTVLDVDPDNFGAYAGDGLDDAWQVNFFGAPPNPDAGPARTPITTHDNHRVFHRLRPHRPRSFFTLEVIDLTGTTTTLELSKIIPGTRYRIERSFDLEQTDPWTEFTNFTTPAEVLDHQLPDPNATGTPGSTAWEWNRSD